LASSYQDIDAPCDVTDASTVETREVSDSPWSFYSRRERGLFLALLFLASISNTFDFAATVALAGVLPSVFATIHAVCGNRRRATAIAAIMLFATLFGGGLGPLVTGALSDTLSKPYGVEGLRYSLIVMLSPPAMSGVALLLCGRCVLADLET